MHVQCIMHVQSTENYLWVTAKFIFNGLLKSNFRPSNRSGFRDTVCTTMFSRCDTASAENTAMQTPLVFL